MSDERDFSPGRTRRNDWSTSREGADAVSFRAGSQKHKLLAAYAAAGREGLTDEEAAEEVGLLSACYWKRSSELREADLIEPTGWTRTGAAGVSRIVCRITPAGGRQVRRLNRMKPIIPATQEPTPA